MRCIKTLNLTKDDEIIVTPRTFIASASCCSWCNIKPIFVDVDINSQNITLDSIHQLTGGMLEYAFPEHTIDTMPLEAIYDWLLKNNIETVLERENMEAVEGSFTLSSFFGITTDEVTNRDFEICMNQLLMTEHDDNEHLRRINAFNNLT